MEQDLLMRRFQILPTVQEDYRSVDANARTMLEAYAAGVNAFIKGADPLPVEYGLVGEHPEPWQAWDCLAVFKVRHIMMGTFEGKLWVARLVREARNRAGITSFSRLRARPTTDSSAGRSV